MLVKYDRHMATINPNGTFGPKWCKAHNFDVCFRADSVPIGSRVLVHNDTEWTVFKRDDAMVYLRNESGETTTRAHCSAMLVLEIPKGRG